MGIGLVIVESKMVKGRQGVGDGVVEGVIIESKVQNEHHYVISRHFTMVAPIDKVKLDF